MIDELLQKSQSQNALPFRVKKFQDSFVVLEFEAEIAAERQEICWPIRQLPKDVRLGEQVWLQFWSTNSRAEERQEILRRLLEELIS